MDKVEQIAMICHEANRAYCISIGDNSQPPWEMAPDWQKDSAKNGVLFHGRELDAGKIPPPSASHDSWLAEKAAAGWKYGPVKNPDAKEHPCFMPYDQLPLAQKLKDYIFSGICKGFWEANRSASGS